MYKGKKITVVIPALNEEANIGGVLDAMPSFVDTVVVVDDGSTDNTVAVARERNAQVVSHGANKGVGVAFNTGLNRALELHSDIMINIDADGQFDPADMEKLLEPLQREEAAFVTASRFKDPTMYPRMPRIKFLGNRWMSSFISRLTGTRFYDVSCGFRAYSREAMLRLNLFGNYTYTQETFLGLAYQHVPITEVPVRVRGVREHGTSRVAGNLFLYGYKTLKIILRTFRDHKPFKFFMITSFVSFMAGLGFGTFLLVYYITAGQLFPHRWAGFVSGFFFMLALFFMGLGFILDIFANMRRTQERMLYFLKARHFTKK